VADAAPRPRKRFGQHFLTDPRILARIADAVGFDGLATVIEIGPGRGGLTEHLVARGPRLIAVEIDRELARSLREQYPGRPDVEIIEADVLKTDLAALATPPYAVVGNLPYYITTPILFHVLRSPLPVRTVFLVQKEVAERMAALAGSEEYGALSVGVQALASVEIVMRVRAGAFTPPPKVDSAVVRLEPRTPPLVEAHQEEALRRLVQGAFGFRRKQMRRVLRELVGVEPEQSTALLESVEIDPETRPETLTPDTFVRLLHALGDARLPDFEMRRS
jgi:16S rRNA (adenine1518-N6/adenine1519-N6)-dimethyltransferase